MFLSKKLKFLMCCTFVTVSSCLHSSTVQTDISEELNPVKEAVGHISKFVNANSYRPFDPESDSEQMNSFIGNILGNLLNTTIGNPYVKALMSLQDAISAAVSWEEVQTSLAEAQRNIHSDNIDKSAMQSNDSMNDEENEQNALYSGLTSEALNQPEIVAKLLNTISMALDNVVAFVKDNRTNPVDAEGINDILGEGIVEAYSVLETLNEDNPLREDQTIINILMSLQDVISNSQDYNQVLPLIAQHQDQIQALLYRIGPSIITSLLQNFIAEQENANATPSITDLQNDLTKELNQLPAAYQKIGKFLLSKTAVAENLDKFLQIVKDFSENIPPLSSFDSKNENLQQRLNQDISELTEKYPYLTNELSQIHCVFRKLLNCQNPDSIEMTCETCINDLQHLIHSRFQEPFLCFAWGLMFDVYECESSEEIRTCWQSVFGENKFQKFLSTCLFLYDNSHISDDEYQKLVKQNQNEYTAVMKFFHTFFQKILNDLLPENYEQDSTLLFHIVRFFMWECEKYFEEHKEKRKIFDQIFKHEFAQLAYLKEIKLQNMYFEINRNRCIFSIREKISDFPQDVQDAWRQFMQFREQIKARLQELHTKMKFLQEIIENSEKRGIKVSQEILRCKEEQLQLRYQFSELINAQGDSLQALSELISQYERQGDNSTDFSEMSIYILCSQNQCAEKRTRNEKIIQQFQRDIENTKKQLTGQKTTDEQL